jgi:hypothetical protein
VPVFRVARGERVPGAKSLDVLEFKSKSGKVKLVVKSERGVSDAKDEAISTDPFGILWIVAHYLLKK